ncbi:Holliday junction resolvase RuvX [Phycicoccus endophyticus]|uniref:Putative pre-16S rRNA nuclease n=1 Tax=Phycicoccus endophyticus TaxID=1690220 RepID=A0A7G9R474_9MICO|nr:Holliday junction resolvase RuvX [Phycicoccus endophyticus]NHI18250.1 Holliday junction resolvase RuvX [Phycicoccus endophyticus]QNN50399.1 Holliday junction resolvase RuvX [Phycicoccus endophyticus]GGL25216.1 putative pre-16S rRNA nuclease [Phycicoccus endophyticus]
MAAPEQAPARGVRLGVDVGSVRVGVAVSDPDGLLATPVETVTRTSSEVAAPGDEDVERVATLVAEYGAAGVVVGLPRSMSGDEGPAAQRARTYAGVLAARVAPVQVRLVDERLTTVDAHRSLRDSGVAGRRQRAVVDQAAAVLILQSALDAERATGAPSGERVPGRRRKPRTKGTRT